MLGPIWIMALACIYFGLATDVTLTSAQSAAQGLLGGFTELH
jgi:multicomponent Na+:H+ antiporter subunit D